jgi:Putative Ig domain
MRILTDFLFRAFFAFAALLCVAVTPSALAQCLPLSELRTLAPAGAHPCDAEYFQPVMYANALFPGQDEELRDDASWIEFDAGTNPFKGTNLATFNNPARFDANGYPKSLAPGRELGLTPWSLNNNYSNRPASWPSLRQLALGKWVLTWTGRADVTLSGGSPVFVAGESNTAATGIATNGRRVYLCATDASLPNKVIVHSLDSANPLTDLKLWLPDPASPQTLSLERPTLPAHQRLFHPSFIARLNDRPWSYIRMMDLGITNNSPVRDWSDRRLPAHVFPTSVLNPRDATDGRGGFALINQPTGIPYEHMVALCNQTGKNLWLNIPHLASADCITRLAKLIKFGSDGVEPYSSVQANPVWPPLDPSLKVFIEYSNEIWNAGTFGQGVWAIGEAAALGTTREQFIASRAATAWTLSEAVLGTSRVVRVGAVQTGSEGYSRALLTAWQALGVQPELMAVTTYFGNNLQYFLAAQGYFTGRLGTDPYWQSPAFEHELDRAFDQWNEYVLTSTAATDPSGRGDNVADAGGIPASVAALATEFGLPMVAYEGGGNFFTSSIDNAPANSAVTIFMEALNRHPRFAELTRTHLEFARSLGLWSHMPFQLSSGWGRNGQWGHVEFMEQLPAASPKYQAVLDWFDLNDRAHNPSALRHSSDPAGAVPAFNTAATLPLAVFGQPYSQTLTFGGGNGALAWTTIAKHLPAGLTWNEATRTLSGTPTEIAEGRLFARVNDADGDPVWRLFSLRVVAPGSPIELEPSADAPVVQFSGQADVNLGAAQQMQIVNPLFDSFFTNPPNPADTDGAKAYLQFDLSPLVQAGIAITSATLELHKATDGSGTPGAQLIVFETGNDWTEGGITFNNRPAGVLTGPAVFGSPLPGLIPPTAFSGDAPLQLNLTSHVQAKLVGGATAVSFVVASANYSGNVPNLASGEHFDATRHPRLILTVAGTPVAAPLKPFTHFSIHSGEFYLVWPAAPGVKVQRNTSATLDPASWTTLPATNGLGGFTEPFNGNRVFYRLLRE